MTSITFKNTPATIQGTLVKEGQLAPDFKLIASDLSEKSLKDFVGKTLILNIFPSLDTGICALSVKQLNELAKKNSDIQVLHISKDLPFAQKRFCQAEAIENSVTLSAFRSSFDQDYGLGLSDTPLKGLLTRCVIVIAPNQAISYVQLVPEITTEPTYAAIEAALG